MKNEYRIKFDKEISKEIFNKIKEKESFVELAKKLDINYNTLKRWRNGKYSIPFFYFKKIVKLHPRIGRYEKQGKFISYYWGCSLGGKKSTIQISKEALNKKMK